MSRTPSRPATFVRSTSSVLACTLCMVALWVQPSCSAVEAVGLDPVPISELMRPAGRLAAKVSKTGSASIEYLDHHWRITGKPPFTVVISPANADHWDVSQWRLVGVPVRNQGDGVVTVGGRLDNPGATGWSNSFPGFAVVPKGESAVLGFPFSQPEANYRGPAIFAQQLAKPNGIRLHWRQFRPENIRSVRMDVRGSADKVVIVVEEPVLAWRADDGLEERLLAMPYLDEFGQVRSLDWPGKSKGIEPLKAALTAELAAAKAGPESRKLGRYGGWSGGPKLRATGRFRTEKVNQKWWLIDPDGYLFFSVGSCSTGGIAETPLSQARIAAGFFESFPPKNDPLYAVATEQGKTGLMALFPALNYARTLGEDWAALSRSGIHDRFRAWGLNTLGAWSDPALQREKRTPYTLIAAPWWHPVTKSAFPSPFKEDYEAAVRKALEQFLWAKDDPFCLGVFLGNELDWPDELGPLLCELPETDSTKKWAIGWLKAKYPALADLNTAWKTSFASWEDVLRDKNIPPAARKDIESLYREFATVFFRKNRAALNAVLPNTLYLGCRTHRGPALLGRAALGHVDIFSLNVYDYRVRAPQLPADVDMPVLASEFHFGAVDRGVPSPGLMASWDQRQRGLAAVHYLASALADPRFVGVHWFQWLDQSAAGRKDRENHQCGFVDVTGRAYSEFAGPVSIATENMYPARTKGSLSVERILEKLLTE